MLWYLVSSVNAGGSFDLYPDAFTTRTAWHAARLAVTRNMFVTAVPPVILRRGGADVSHRLLILVQGGNILESNPSAKLYYGGSVQKSENTLGFKRESVVLKIGNCPRISDYADFL